MSFFKKNPPKNEDSQSEKVAISSIIGDGMNILGDVTFSGKLRLDGHIKGNIQGEYLILGETGKVTGDIETDTSSLQGTVIGNIKSRNMTVTKGCRIEGNVITVNLSVESGAALNGEVKVDEKDLRLIKNAAQPNVENAASTNNAAGKPLAKASSQ